MGLELFIGAAFLMALTSVSLAVTSRLRRPVSAVAELARRRGGSVETIGNGDPIAVLVADGVRLAVGTENTLVTSCVHWTAYLEKPGTIPFELAPSASPEARPHDGAPARQRLGEFFTIETADPDAFDRIWKPEACDIMLRFFADGSMFSSGNEIKLRQERAAVDVELLETGVDLLLGIARADAFGLAALRSLSGARDAATGPDVIFAVVIERPTRITIGPERVDGRPRTRARARFSTNLQPGEADLVRGAPVEESAVASLPHHARRHLRDLGSAHVEWAEDAATVTWTSIEADPNRLEAAVALLDALGRPPPSGVFR